MKKLMRWGALFILSTTVHADCETMTRTSWSVDVASRKITKLAESSESQKFCQPVLQDSKANLLLTFQSGDKVFERRVFVARDTIHERLDDSKELRPTILPNKILYIDSYIPLWAKKADLKITSLPDQQILGTSGGQL